MLIKCDIQELEEQTIVRYLGGLEPRYTNVVELQQYSTFNEVCVLAHKVEQQKRRQQPRREHPTKNPKTTPFNKGSSRLPYRRRAVHLPVQQTVHPKTQNPPFPTFPQNTPAPQKAYPTPNRAPQGPMNPRRCFKSQGLGHVVADCPNRRVITLAE